MERTRAIEIIEAYGGDPARWPEGEREGVRALVSSDLPLRRMADEALALDALLGGWAAAGPADDAAAAMAAAEAALAVADRPQRRWLPAGLFGGAAAAAAVTAALLLSPARTTQTTPVSQPAVQQTASADTAIDNHIWSMTFTPTPEEESLI